jgi:protein Shroom
MLAACSYHEYNAIYPFSRQEVLVSRISRKLEILRIEQSEIREEIDSNEQLGQIVIERVKETAKRNEFDKFKLHVEEIEKITSLLLGLSGRLARTENALMGLAENPNPQEKVKIPTRNRICHSQAIHLTL